MCTGIRFTDGSGHMYFGRNLDWGFSYGERPFITPRNYVYRCAFGADCLPQRSTPLAVMGMGIAAEGIPLYFDCANEAGLALAGLNFPGFAEYEKAPVGGKVNLAAYEFPLWVARSFASVDEVEEALADVALVGVPVNAHYANAFLHWLIGDAQRSIVVEYLSDGLHVYHDDVDVLTNQPRFDWHRENLRNYLTLTSDVPEPAQWRRAELTPYGTGGGMRGLPGDYYSPSRFVRAAYLNAHYPVKDTEEENVTRLFRTLGGTAMIDGAARMTDGTYERTIYTSGYSSRTKTYYHATYDNPALKSHTFEGHDLDAAELIWK